MLRVNGFYGHVQKNHGRSIILFLGFLAACHIAMGVLLTVPIMLMGETNFMFVDPIGYLKEWGLQVTAISAVLFALRYHFHTHFMKSAIGFDVVSQNTHPRLVSIITNHAIAAGVPIPMAAVIPNPALNAFACGLSRSNATVVVTQGLLNGLDDDELSAVIAHEIAHIMNGDMQMMAVANASMGTVDMINNVNPFKFRGGKSVIFAVLFLPLVFMFLMFGVAMSVASTITKVSRLLIASSREFIADAEAVRLTHNPGALISALRKIEGRSTIDGIDPMADAMMIDGAVEGTYATHPPISERIAVLTQHSGSMVHGQAPRNDSRTRAQVVAYNTAVHGSERPVFGRAQTVAAVDGYAAKPAHRRNIIDRVNNDSTTNVFGMTPNVGRMLLIGICVFFVFKMIAMKSLSDTFSALDAPMTTSQSQNRKVTVGPMLGLTPDKDPNADVRINDVKTAQTAARKTSTPALRSSKTPN